MNNKFIWGIALLVYINFIPISNSKIQVSYKNMLNMLLIIDVSNKCMLDILKYLMSLEKIYEFRKLYCK